MKNPFKLITPDEYTHLISTGGTYKIVKVNYNDSKPSNLFELDKKTNLNTENAKKIHVWNGYSINSSLPRIRNPSAESLGNEIYLPRYNDLDAELAKQFLKEHGPFYEQCVYFIDTLSEIFKALFGHGYKKNEDLPNVLLIPNKLKKVLPSSTFDTFKDFIEEL